MGAPLLIDGSHGEGGGQILRTALGLAAITGRAVRIENIRANRARPGLAAQHLTSVRAVAALCQAEVAGDRLNSTHLDFMPRSAPRSGDYDLDVAAARAGGSAGSTTLVLQAVLLPLAVADGASRLHLAGGTHMSWSPPFDYVRDVLLPTLAAIGIDATAAMGRSGWFPIGQGEIDVTIVGDARPQPLTRVERGPLRCIAGRAIAASLPARIAQRMADRATKRLAETGMPVEIVPTRLNAACPGAGIFLTAEYEAARAGFSALGRRGLPAEAVADQAVGDLQAHHRAGAALDEHLADQMLAPLALASGPSSFTTTRLSRHLASNAWVIERFGLARIDLAERDDGTGLVTVTPATH